MTEETADAQATEETTGVEELTTESIASMTPEEKREKLAELTQGPAYEEGDVEQDSEQESPAQGDVVNATPEQQRIAELEQQLRDKQLAFDRQGNEVGELRNYLKNQRELLERSIEDDRENGFSKVAQDPFGAVEEHQQKQAELQRIQQQEAMLHYQENTRATRELIGSRIEGSDELMDNVRDLLKQDGVPEEQLAQVDPYGMNRDTAYNLFKRAELARENQELRAQLEQLQGSNGTVLKNIDRAARVGGRVAGKAGNSVTEIPGLTREKIKTMTLEEKKKELAKIQRLM